MPITLHDALVPTCLQILGSVGGLIDKAEAHCRETGTAAEDLIGSRLAPDMNDFAYQVKSCAVHSVMAIEGCMAGSCSPDFNDAPRSFAGLRAMITDAKDRLSAIDPADVEALIGKPIRFVYADVLDWSFTADQFLLSFSQPNFHFHATTAYDLLRMKGVPLGKTDYLGALRMSV